MIRDDNKGIQNIVYNHLNLPTTIDFGSLGRIFYLYDATGKKLRKLVHDNGAGHDVVTDYLDGFQYKNAAMQFFPTAEGYVNVTQNNVGSAPDPGGKAPPKAFYNYVYNYVDHLGNIRLSYSRDPATGVLKIIEENHYYPFGLKHSNYNTDKNMITKEEIPLALTAVDPSMELKIKPETPLLKSSYSYKYNGKELQDELGLNMYDYGARNYDPAIGRWGATDGKAELYFSKSPYVYASNTPINAIDPDGNIVIFINGQHGASGKDYWRNYTGNESNFLSMPNKQAFDIAVMDQLGDHKPLYKDGAMGGWKNTLTGGLIDDGSNGGNNLSPINRINAGREQGKLDAKKIIDGLRRDETTLEIVETIKIITHSMGGAYGKGYVEALKEYIKTLPKEQQAQIKISLVVDFDPLDASSLTADGKIPTFQYKHKGNSNISGFGFLANEDENGKVEIQTNTGDSTDHTILSFMNDVKDLSDGTYKWDATKKQWVKQ